MPQLRSRLANHACAYWISKDEMGAMRPSSGHAAIDESNLGKGKDMLNTSTLRPGLLVSLKTTITGNVRYRKETIEGEHITTEGEQKASWNTERTISDPAEHDAAVKARTVARTAITRVCSASAFGLLCPESKAADLEQAVREARAVADRFNSTATLTRLSVYVITGRVAADDV